MENRQQAKDIPTVLVLRLAAEMRAESWTARRHSYPAIPDGLRRITIIELDQVNSIKTLPQRVAACGFDAKLSLYKVERLCYQDFLDYGTSCNFAWPTEKGLKYLQENG